MNPWSFFFGTDDPSATPEADREETTDGTGSPRTPADVLVETGLTPEEFVLEEIRSRGRPISQQEICRFTGWSDSRVSHILSEMEDAGTIGRVRLGRENLVFLPDAKWELMTPTLIEDE